MRAVALEDITEHYPETLSRWRERFVAAADRAAALGYDRAFRRLWELYFAYCEGGFRERRIRVVQLELSKPGARGATPSRGSTLEALGAHGVGSPGSGGAAVSRGGHLPGGQPDGALRDGVSIVLGDLRTAAAQASRDDLADHERLYFRRLLDLHVREGLGLAVTEHRERDDVRRFVVDPAGRGAGRASRARVTPV